MSGLKEFPDEDFSQFKVTNHVENANNISDLVSVIENVIPLDEIKELLLKRLTSSNSKEEYDFAKLYLSTTAIDKLFEDKILVRILMDFLPQNETLYVGMHF